MQPFVMTLVIYEKAIAWDMVNHVFLLIYVLRHKFSVLTSVESFHVEIQVKKIVKHP